MRFRDFGLFTWNFLTFPFPFLPLSSHFQDFFNLQKLFHMPKMLHLNSISRPKVVPSRSRFRKIFLLFFELIFLDRYGGYMC